MAQYLVTTNDLIDPTTGLYRDNTSGLITPQSLRDFVVSTIGLGTTLATAPTPPNTNDVAGYFWNYVDGSNIDLKYTYYTNYGVDPAVTVQLTSGNVLGSTTTPATFDTLIANGAATFDSTTYFNSNVVATQLLGTNLAPTLETPNWTLGTGWAYVTVPTKKLQATSATGTVTPTASTTIVAGTTYKITIVIDSILSSTATYTLGGVSGTPLTAAMTLIDYITASTTGQLIITPAASLNIVISSISIQSTTAITANCPAVFLDTSKLWLIDHNEVPPFGAVAQISTGTADPAKIIELYSGGFVIAAPPDAGGVYLSFLDNQDNTTPGTLLYTATSGFNFDKAVTFSAAERRSKKVIAVTDSPYAILTTDRNIYADCTSGAITITLPAATATGRMLMFEKIDSSANTLTITANGSDNIYGNASLVIYNQWSGAETQDAAVVSGIGQWY
jgi:hypothetical protein